MDRETDATKRIISLCFAVDKKDISKTVRQIFFNFILQHPYESRVFPVNLVNFVLL